MSTEIIVVRHGETKWNLEHRMQGHSDSELTDVGLKQAEAVARRLASESVNALYTSDLNRARVTADYIARTTGLQVNAEPRLRERNLGILQGLTIEEVESRYPEEYKRWRSRFVEYAIRGGESLQQFFGRAVAATQDIVDRHPFQRVVLVTHGGVLSMLLRNTLGIPLAEPRRYQLANGSISRFVVGHGIWELVTWSDANHLGTLRQLDDR